MKMYPFFLEWANGKEPAVSEPIKMATNSMSDQFKEFSWILRGGFPSETQNVQHSDLKTMIPSLEVRLISCMLSIKKVMTNEAISSFPDFLHRVV